MRVCGVLSSDSHQPTREVFAARKTRMLHPLLETQDRFVARQENRRGLGPSREHSHIEGRPIDSNRGLHRRSRASKPRVGLPELTSPAAAQWRLNAAQHRGRFQVERRRGKKVSFEDFARDDF
jgi:hypothetical protein